MATQQDLSAFGLEQRRYSFEEWRAIEERTEERFEYLDGQLVYWRDMAGGSPTHALISGNLNYELGRIVRLPQLASI